MNRMRMRAAGGEWVELSLTLGRDGAFTWEDGGLSLQGRIVATETAPGEAEGWLDVDGRITPFSACRVKDRVHVWAGGTTVWLELEGAGRSRGAAAGPSGDEIVAPMPGTLLKVHVRAGSDVEAQQPLLVMESMKMELTLYAPRTGRVEHVLVKEGDLVDMGAVLARLERTSS